MQNSSTILAPPPLPPPPPPRPAGQINVLPATPPPQFLDAPSSVFQITVLPAPPPPPFADSSSSVDFSPLEFVFAVVAIVTIPALIYTFILAFRCSSSGERQGSAVEFSGDPSVASELSRRDDVEVAAAGNVADAKHQKEERTRETGGECPVCLSAFADDEEVRQLSACKHAFHASCIDMWLANHSNCPICRTAIATAVAAADKRSGSNSRNPSRDSDPRQGHRDLYALV